MTYRTPFKYFYTNTLFSKDSKHFVKFVARTNISTNSTNSTSQPCRFEHAQMLKGRGRRARFESEQKDKQKTMPMLLTSLQKTPVKKQITVDFMHWIQ